ncbi:MAG: CPBP family intramembrane metalloprotease [Chloroflexota bacterium]|nr:CPBP family intramembrane metalloprotease [Chloroflexota bacterium]
MLLTVVAIGRGRWDVFLTKGDLRAPVQPNAIFKKPRPWIMEAREFIVIFSLGIIIFNWLLLHPDLGRLGLAISNLPFILLGAALNSSSEETMFRAVLLGQLVPALGAQQALWLQATFFGLVHWSGNPSGPLGVLLAGFLGWFLGKSVLETRGLAIAIASHFLLNTIQYVMFALVQA